MAKFIMDLRTRLQSEHQFISSQKQVLSVLSKEVETKLSDLYLLAWFFTYLKELYDKVKPRVLQPKDFVKIVQYKRALLSPDIKLAGEITFQTRPNLILSMLRHETEIVALLFLREGRTDKLDMLARIVYTSVFGSLITAEDEFHFLKVMMELLSRELEECHSSYDMFQKGSGFKSLFSMYVESSVEVKGFFLTLIQRQISFLMDEEVFLEFEESKAELHAGQGFPDAGECSADVSSEEIKLKIRESAKFIGSLITNLIKQLNQEISLTPYTIRILANLMKREISRKWTLPLEAIQSCLANLIFGFFIVPVIADPVSFGLVEDSLLTDRIRSNFNCMATVLQNLPRLHWRRLSSDLRLVFKYTNLSLYTSYIDSLVLDQGWQNELMQGTMDVARFKSTACFFYKKVDIERTHFLISNSDLVFLRESIACLNRNVETNRISQILNSLSASSVSFAPTLEKQEPAVQTIKGKHSTPQTSNFPLPKLLLFPIKETEWDQPNTLEIKTEEEVIHGKKATCSLRDIAKENTAIESALKESYCIENGDIFLRSSKTRHNSISGYDTLRRQVDSVCHLSSIENSTASSSSTESEDKSYEGDTSGIGSLANSNSSSYKANFRVRSKKKRPPLPPYPSTDLPSWESPLDITVFRGHNSSGSDTLERSNKRNNLEGRMRRSMSLGGKEEFENFDPDLYENAEYLRKPKVSPKKSATTDRLSPAKQPVTISGSLPAHKIGSPYSTDKKVFLRKGNKIRKKARNMIISTFGHSKHSKQTLSLSDSQTDLPNLRDVSSTSTESDWVRLRSTTFTNMTLKTPPKPIPSSKYFTLLPLDTAIHPQNTDLTSILKRIRLFLSASAYPDFNVPEPQLLPSEIWEQISQLELENVNSTESSQNQISMSDEVANKRSLISILYHEFNLAISYNDTTRIALASDLLHIIDVMAASQVESLLRDLQKDLLSRKEYIRYLTQTSLKLIKHQDQILSYEKSFLSQIEEVEKSFMDSEIRAFFQQHSVLSHLDRNLSLTPNKPITIHKHIYDALEQMSLDPLWHNWEHHTAMLYSVERIVYNHVFYGLFFPKGASDQKENEEFTLSLECLSKILKVDDSFLSIDKKYHFSSPWPSALQLLYTLNLYKTPRDKLDVISNCCKLITNLLHFTDPLGVLGADEILPVLIFVTVHSNPRYLKANSTYLELYSDNIDIGENAYWFHQFLFTIRNIESLVEKNLL